MDRLEAMSLLLSAVESGSLSKASRKLRLPLATLSRKISDLEAHLHANLLTRSAKGLELTPAGRSYVIAIKAVLEQLNEAERMAAGEYMEPRGDLAVTAPVIFGRLHALPVITRFLAAYPDVSVSLVQTDRVADFPDDQVDVALRIGELPDSDLIATRLGAVRRICCASPAYLASHGVPARPEDLMRHDIVSSGLVSVPGIWRFGSKDAEQALPLRARLGVNTLDAAIEAALAGAGCIRPLSYQVAEHVRSGRLCLLLEAFEPAPLPVHLVYGKQNRLPLKLRAFVDFAVPLLRERIAGAAI